ncbi:MAG: J domain-containing protein [Chloroflexi bacterium]|nr:J domain-containing protein [Chloroflexota bacterium]
MTSHYNTLGVAKGAKEKEIRQAYRRLARRYHPDLNPGDEDAERRFKEINEAYEVLSDSEKRGKYDRYGDNWKHADQIEPRSGSGGPFHWKVRRGGSGGPVGSDPFGGLEDLLEEFGGFGGGGGRRSRSTQAEVAVTISLEEAFSGTKRLVTVTSRGRSRRLEVTIPPGVDNGSVVSISPEKDQKILLNVSVSSHVSFERKGNDLYVDAKVPYEDAVLGSETEIETLSGRVRLRIPPESQNGQKIRLAGQGMPKRHSLESRGDLYVTLRPMLPEDLTDEERELVRRLKELRESR